MLKVLVVEDEYYSRKVLVKLLKEIESDVVILAEAETGKQALEILKENMVDLVITDIRMPEMDGLKLASYIAKDFPETKVMITSGYADFEYAREAITYGVKDYLTKPVKLEELKQSVKKLTSQNRKESLQYINFLEITKDNMLIKQLFGDCYELFERYSYQMFVFQNEVTFPKGKAEMLLSSMKAQLEYSNLSVFYFRPFEEFIVIVFDTEEELGKKRYHILLNHVIEKLLEDNISLTAGSSRIYHTPEQLENGYRDSIYAINRRLLEEKNKVYEFETDMNISFALGKDQEIILYDSVQNYNYEQAAKVIEGFFSQTSGQSMDIYTLYSTLMQIFNIVNKSYCNRDRKEESEEEGRYLLFSFKTDLYTFRYRNELKEYVLNILKNTCTQRDMNSDDICQYQEKNNMIHEIKEYVSHNFQYDISLNELACHKYFMNPSYLSRLFKGETGVNFSKYLIEYRLTRAKELLENTVFKVNEIAAYVGYNDPSHFIQIFKKYNNITPEQYRAKLQ